MSLAVINSRAQLGTQAPQVSVEVHLSPGIPGMTMVGLPETVVKESKDRVRSALINSKFDFPPKRITINLAPADLPKQNGRFDLPISIGILAASAQIPQNQLHKYEFIGELALTGHLRPVPGVMPIALASKKQNYSLILPIENAKEAGLIEGLQVLPAKHLLDVCAHLCGESSITPYQGQLQNGINEAKQFDMQDVKGQFQARRALEIAAAGGHNLLFIGPPGTGKTIQARVIQAREKQYARQHKVNCDLLSKQIDQFCHLAEQERIILDNAMDKLGLSARAYHRTLKVARTIADLNGAEMIQVPHITEALGYRANWKLN